MDVTKDAITRVVSSARMAYNLANIISQLVPGITDENRADMIFGSLADVLFELSKEPVVNDFKSSKTYKWLVESCMSNEEVADELIRMADANKPKQPAPILMTQEEYDALYGTPEGEWPI